MISGERINAIVASVLTQLEMLMQSVRELNERGSTGFTEKNVTSNRRGNCVNVPTVV